MPALTVRLQQAAPIPLDAEFSCAAGELLALVGPSGSGKTTILRVIAGLARSAAGRVMIGNQTWFDADNGIDMPPQQRRPGLVFQNYALFPHLSALGNVAIASARADAVGHARQLLTRMRLEELADRRPAQMSGGQRQRVALARALAREPQALLLDEPFSAVDQAARQDLYQELAELRSGLAIPIVLVTHDLQEAQRLADRLVVIDRGKVLAAGDIDDLLARPEIARHMPGLDAGSLLHCRVQGHDARYGLTVLAIDGDAVLRVPQVDVPVGTMVRVRVPARDVALALSQPVDVSTVNRLPGELLTLEPFDATYVDARVRIGAGVQLRARLTRESSERLALTPGLAVWCLIKSVALDRATLMLTVEPGIRPSSSAVPAANDASAASRR
ncbi:MAG TPA: molybdenum ABC transporter ATP-binding protein [Burkholderiaceae bacterium]|nr:molybdenum ABC transporter ATP-binding protein [Burkholderiaceae bacterium]HQR68967.1 molybdenum ABC transporter ATP-binding protein [Burkholderiaceae bacterium]